MLRTLATISTESGLAAICHDDSTGTLTARYSDGTTESLSDYTATKSWAKARRQVIAWYGNSRAKHDTWVLCLRPVESLRNMRSEETAYA